MPTQMIIMGVFMLGAVGYSVWVRGKAKQQLENSRPAIRKFFEVTGYRYADMEQQPIEAHVERNYRAFAEPNNPDRSNVHMVRNFHGVRIHQVTRNWSEKNGTTTTIYSSNQWDAEVPAPPRIPVHIADKSLASVLKTVGEAFSNSKRHFEPKCSQKVETGVPSIEDKYVVYGENPDAVRHLFQQNPGLVSLLQNWGEMDLWITARGATFNDPSSKNITAAMGGMVGSMAIGFDVNKRTDAMLPVHDRIAELLATLVRATA